MLKYPLSFIVYITLSFLFGCLLFFAIRTNYLFNAFLFIAIALLIGSSVLLLKSKNNLSFLLAVLSIFFIAYLYTSYRYKYIENEVDYSNKVVAFSAKVISYDGAFNYKYGLRERYICEVNSIYDNTNWYKTYFRIRLYNASQKEIKINDRLIVNSKINFYKNILTNDNEEYDNDAIVNALENKMLLGVSSLYRSEKFVIDKRVISPINLLNMYAVKIRNYIKLSLKDNLAKDNRAIILSIAIGDKTELTGRLRNTFSNVGLSHILAVSGLHLSIVVLIFNLFLFFIIRKETLRFSISIILSILIFAPITLFSISIVRASIMYFLIFTTLALGKKLNSLHNLFLAALIILISNPIAILDLSFQFSFLATFGIITYYSVYDSIKKNRIVAVTTNFIALSISAIIMILPLSIYNFKVLNLASIVSNVYAGVYAFIIILLTFINTLLYVFAPSVSIYSSTLLNKIISSFIFIAEKQEALNILKYDANINMMTALLLTLLLSALAIVLKCKIENVKIQNAGF